MARTKKPEKELPDEIRLRIIGKSEELFFKYGFSRITISEIVSDLGMSKKTLYRYFSNKNELIAAVLSTIQDELIRRIDLILDDEKTAYIARLKSIFEVLSNFFSRVSGSIIEDLKRHFPDVWKSMNEFKQKMSYERIMKILHEGTERGLFRTDIDPRLILIMYLSLVEGFITQDRLSNRTFSAKEMFDSTFKILYSGILTDSARKTFLQG